MDHHYIEILEYLEPYGIGRSVSLNPILNMIFPVTIDMNSDESVIREWYYAEGNKVKTLLRSMTNHIQLSPGLDRLLLSRTTIGTEIITLWLHNTEIAAHITADGLQFLNSIRSQAQAERVSQSVIDTNTATATLYKRQNRLYYITLAIAVLSVLFPALSYFQDNKVDELNSKLQLQNVELHQTKHKLQLIEVQYDSISNVSVKNHLKAVVSIKTSNK